MDSDDYCRELEAHLCRRNEGHLIRVVGPAFELVRGWARQGIPLKVAMQGIDRYVTRASARGPRRRPIRMEFCEADILDAFDAWRRAVGVRAALVDDDAGGLSRSEVPDGAEPVRSPGRGRESLATHLDRVIVRLTARRAGDVDPTWDAALDDLVRRLDAMHPTARRARGEARDRLIAELGLLDAQWMDAARAMAPPGVLAAASCGADEELEPFRSRLSADAFAAAHRRIEDRILREQLDLPTLVFE
ncbi:MAG: hypothetical protein NTY02_08745 [Acidobacteria bacterium]|nr:hypothetical protein [Acidobacteriota bacterium]